MDIQKWNFKTHEYEPYNPDPQWTIKLMSGSMNEIVNCADCGTNVLYGETYTSRAIHNSVGFGYPVCGKCYQEERQEEEMN